MSDRPLSTIRPVPHVNIRNDKACDGKFDARRDGTAAHVAARGIQQES